LSPACQVAVAVELAGGPPGCAWAGVRAVANAAATPIPARIATADLLGTRDRLGEPPKPLADHGRNEHRCRCADHGCAGRELRHEIAKREPEPDRSDRENGRDGDTGIRAASEALGGGGRRRHEAEQK